MCTVGGGETQLWLGHFMRDWWRLSAWGMTHFSGESGLATGPFATHWLFCVVFFFSPKMVNKSFLSDYIKNGPCSFAAEVFQLTLSLYYKLYQSIVHSRLDLGQIYAPEKILFLHDLDKKMCLNSVTQPNLYETGILPPGVSGLLCETCLVCD